MESSSVCPIPCDSKYVASIIDASMASALELLRIIRMFMVPRFTICTARAMIAVDLQSTLTALVYPNIKGNMTTTNNSITNEPNESAEGAASDVANVGSSAALISFFVIISRITGFRRTWAMAFALGSTMLASSYQVANNLPNMLYELVVGGWL